LGASIDAIGDPVAIIIRIGNSAVALAGLGFGGIVVTTVNAIGGSVPIGIRIRSSTVAYAGLGLEWVLRAAINIQTTIWDIRRTTATVARCYLKRIILTNVDAICGTIAVRIVIG
jgi:hypothetical protein